jgi:50S ribosomal subunit-associated GTPase HflX
MRDEDGKISEVRLSAVTGDGIELLREALAEFAAQHPNEGHIVEPFDDTHTQSVTPISPISRQREQFENTSTVH